MATSPTSGPGGGGSYTAPTSREECHGAAVTIANGASGILTWDTHDAGSVLLDRSNTQIPTVITAGIYHVLVIVRPQAAMTIGGSIEGLLDIDRAGDDAQIRQLVAAIASRTNPPLTLQGVHYCAAGAQLKVTLNNFDGVQGLDFAIEDAWAQRIT